MGVVGDGVVCLFFFSYSLVLAHLYFQLGLLLLLALASPLLPPLLLPFWKFLNAPVLLAGCTL